MQKHRFAVTGDSSQFIQKFNIDYDYEPESFRSSNLMQYLQTRVGRCQSCCVDRETVFAMLYSTLKRKWESLSTEVWFTI